MRKVFSCALMLVVSVVMLFGTTYAWFTADYVVEKNHVILGELKMDQEFRDPNENSWHKFTPGNSKLFDIDKDNKNKRIILQPGSVIVKEVRVHNIGNIDMVFKPIIENEIKGFNLEYSVKHNGTGKELLVDDLYVFVKVGEFEDITVTLTIPTEINVNDNMNKENFFDFKLHAEQAIRFPDKIVNPKQ